MAVFIHKSMRRSIHFYMLNLAIIDIIILLLSIPTQSFLIYNQLEWNMGSGTCSMVNVIIPTCLSCSIATLMAISIDRYSGVRDPFSWRVTSRRNSKMVVPLLWILSILIAIPYFIHGGLKRMEGEGVEGCRCLWSNSPFKTSYMTIMMGIQFILPFCVIASVYMHIVCIISRGHESINHLHRRMVKMVIMLLVTYFVCDGMQYFYFYYQEYKGQSPHLYVISNMLLTLQAAINPVIYNSTRDDFNLAFKSLYLGCRFKLGSVIGDDKCPELTEYPTETDTERWFDVTTGRRGSVSSRARIEKMSRKRSSVVSPPQLRKKSTIFGAIRKQSMQHIRKKSSIRIPRNFELEYDSSIDGSVFEEDEEPSFRSYRLGTLEFLELEEFHEKMKESIRKESTIRKISRKISRIGTTMLHGSIIAEHHETEQRNPSPDYSSENSEFSNKRFSSFDSVSTRNSTQCHHGNGSGACAHESWEERKFSSTSAILRAFDTVTMEINETISQSNQPPPIHTETNIYKGKEKNTPRKVSILESLAGKNNSTKSLDSCIAKRMSQERVRKSSSTSNSAGKKRRSRKVAIPVYEPGGIQTSPSRKISKKTSVTAISFDKCNSAPSRRRFPENIVFNRTRKSSKSCSSVSSNPEHTADVIFAELDEYESDYSLDTSASQSTLSKKSSFKNKDVSKTPKSSKKISWQIDTLHNAVDIILPTEMRNSSINMKVGDDSIYSPNVFLSNDVNINENKSVGDMVNSLVVEPMFLRMERSRGAKKKVSACSIVSSLATLDENNNSSTASQLLDGNNNSPIACKLLDENNNSPIASLLLDAQESQV